MPDTPPRIFDRTLYRARRARAARLNGDLFLADDAASQIALRVAAINRRFTLGLDLYSRTRIFSVFAPLAERWVRAGASEAPQVVADEEALPFAEASFDLIVSVLSLHAVNDLPGALLQIRRGLRPDGVFVGALFGGDTLKELRLSFAAAETEHSGGVSPRVAPFADVRDLGGLLQRAGFALPVADSERTTVRYRGLDRLFQDIRALGETNVLVERRNSLLSRRMVQAVAAEYAARFGDARGRLTATFEIVFLTGWAPHESQQKPLVPGSARGRLADALGTVERKTGDAAEPGPRKP